MDSAFSELWCTIEDGKFNWNLGSQYSQYRLEKLGKEIKAACKPFELPSQKHFLKSSALSKRISLRFMLRTESVIIS